jgi:hypothetical protein
MVIVPVRELVVVLAATEYETVPLPLPLVPAVTLIQLTPLEAVQLQLTPAVTPTLPVPPADVNAALPGEMA